MTVELKTPQLPESVADAVIATWHKRPGDPVAQDENIVDIETDKVVLEVPAPAAGILTEIKEPEGTTVVAGQLLGLLEPAGSQPSAPPATPAANESGAPTAETPAEPAMSPSVRRHMAEHGLSSKDIRGSGKSGRILMEDVQAHVDRRTATQATPAPEAKPVTETGERLERRVPMTRLRARIAERLVQAQHTAAILTTFNEVNMQPVMALRSRYKETFEKQHGVRLGFMSFFVKAATEALKRFPEVNASIDGTDIVYHGYYDIGVAVSSPRGLVVPILRDTDQLGMAEIEKGIGDFAARAQDGRLDIDELTGGTFSISNGGVFGSLLSTPILNPPQSAILGMHKIEDRPVAENGQIVIRPMMYLALSYDHRIIDGSGAVRFLVTIKEALEDPARMLLEI